MTGALIDQVGKTRAAIMLLLEHSPKNTKQLRAETGLGDKAMLYHLDALKKLNLVERIPGTRLFRLMDPAGAIATVRAATTSNTLKTVWHTRTGALGAPSAPRLEPSIRALKAVEQLKADILEALRSHERMSVEKLREHLCCASDLKFDSAVGALRRARLVRIISGNGGPGGGNALALTSAHSAGVAA